MDYYQVNRAEAGRILVWPDGETSETQLAVTLSNMFIVVFVNKVYQLVARDHNTIGRAISHNAFYHRVENHARGFPVAYWPNPNRDFCLAPWTRDYVHSGNMLMSKIIC